MFVARSFVEQIATAILKISSSIGAFVIEWICFVV